MLRLVCTALATNINRSAYLRDYLTNFTLYPSENQVMRNIIILFLLLSTGFGAAAQIPDHNYRDNIQGVKLSRAGDMLSYPIIRLNSSDQLELHFDDLDADV